MTRKFEVSPGWIIARPYIEKEKTFISNKEVAGDIQKSEVLFIGDNYLDENGNLRNSPCKIKDIILHQYTSNDTEIGFDKYRAVRFYEVIAILK
jgi:co-chaperonin GroES (HSP10)